MTQGCDPAAVAASFALMVFGLYTSLELACRARGRGHAGSSRPGWVAASALAFALAVWSMHVVAMLAYTGQVHAALSLGTMTAAFLLSLPLIGGAVLSLSGPRRPGVSRVIAAGVMMGVGICLTHYMGIGAVGGGQVLIYDPVRVAASAFLAVAASTATLFVASRRQHGAAQALSAAGLGAAIAATHYIGISSMAFRRCGPAAAVPRLPIAWVIAGVTVACGLLFLLALLATLFDRRIGEMTLRETRLIRRSEQRLKNILEQLPLGIGIADVDSGKVLIANREAVSLLGARLDQTGLEPVSARDGIADADRTPLRRALRGETFEGELFRQVRADGTAATLAVGGRPILDEAGEQVLAVATFQDVSARLRAEAELRQALKMEALGQLTGGIAHDFNNLLTAVLGNLDLLAPSLATDEQRVLLRNALEATERGARLTAQLLGFSRRQALRPEPVDVNAAVASMSELLLATLGGTVTVGADVAPDLWTALADRTQLELVLLNLAINARDAMPLGGAMLIRTENVRLGPPVRATDPPQGDHVMLSVSDDGTGMDADTLARVFEPFFTTKPPGKGSGLGLPQVLGIAQQLGGGVRIQSELGVGTTVQLFMPRGRTGALPQAEAHRPLANEPAGLTGRTILLVDDDRDVRSATATALAHSGATVLEAANGQAGLAMLTDHPWIEAIVLDYAMPGMTGDEVARRARLIAPSLPIVLVTGYADPDRLGSLPADLPILHKPFRSTALVGRLAMLLPPPAAARATGSVVTFPAPRGRARQG